MNRSRNTFALLLSAALVTTEATVAFAGNAPQSRQCDGNGEEIGRVVGGIAGAIIGNRFGRGSGRVFSTILGGAVGAWLGGEIGRELDCESQRRAAKATGDALQSGQPGSWQNPEAGTSGTVSVQAPSSEVAAANPGRECRTVNQAVTLADGRVQYHGVQACRNSDGSWSPV
jgi:surface antigen